MDIEDFAFSPADTDAPTEKLKDYVSAVHLVNHVAATTLGCIMDNQFKEINPDTPEGTELMFAVLTVANTLSMDIVQGKISDSEGRIMPSTLLTLIQDQFDEINIPIKINARIEKIKMH